MALSGGCGDMVIVWRCTSTCTLCTTLLREVVSYQYLKALAMDYDVIGKVSEGWFSVHTNIIFLGTASGTQ